MTGKDGILALLRGGRERIKDRRGWTTGADARDLFGKEVSVSSDAAQSFCAFGAVVRQGYEEPHLIPFRLEAFGVLNAQAKAWAEAHYPELRPVKTISGLNDQYGQEAVLAAFDAAIAEVELWP